MMVLRRIYIALSGVIIFSAFYNIFFTTTIELSNKFALSLTIVGMIFTLVSGVIGYYGRLRLISSKIFIYLQGEKLFVENSTDYPIRDLLIFNYVDDEPVPILVSKNGTTLIDNHFLKVVSEAYPEEAREYNIIKVKELFSGTYSVNSIAFVKDHNQKHLLGYAFVDFFGLTWIKKPYKNLKLVDKKYLDNIYNRVLKRKYGSFIESEAELTREK